MACALYILNLREVHGRYLRKAVGPFRAPGDQSWTQALPSVTKVTDPRRPLPWVQLFSWMRTRPGLLSHKPRAGTRWTGLSDL